ncbi:unnamed protein product [Angiostrongylus costaricensis]|uniref:Gelsolin-like domain-containing protein n=1 Tax=Angiostrongylus costaricensis TaxID=334426 RepID=A0A0R3PZX8_ANGCS|nr:unnamed protein product [Angiostrongylus costaricensis]
MVQGKTKKRYLRPTVQSSSLRSYDLTLLRADDRVESDEKGPMTFLWKSGKIGERVTIGKGNFRYSTENQEILACIEIDVWNFVNESFNDVGVLPVSSKLQIM